MEEKKSNKGLVVTVIILIVLLLGAVGYICYDKFMVKEEANESKIDVNNSTDADLEKNTRDEIVKVLKEKLTDDLWIKNNLYSDKDCFGNKLISDEQDLTFSLLSDNESNPIVIVLNKTIKDNVNTAYKVYFDNGDIRVSNIGGVNHPDHVNYSIDVEQNLVIYTYAQMKNYVFTAYDVKDKEVTVYDKYECTTGDCSYEYKGDKHYNTSNISLELNEDNVNNYIK